MGYIVGCNIGWADSQAAGIGTDGVVWGQGIYGEWCEWYLYGKAGFMQLS